MQAFHTTSDPLYRNPVGALRLGDTVKLCIDVWDDMPRSCTLRLWTEEAGEQLVGMQGCVHGCDPDRKTCTVQEEAFAQNDARVPMDARVQDDMRQTIGRHAQTDILVRYSTCYIPSASGLVWYSFNIEASDGAIWRYGAQEGWVTGEGAFAWGQPPSFQITVYEPRRDTEPSWYRQGIAYQIFPDRFARDEAWLARSRTALEKPHVGIARNLIEDWDTPPTYRKNPDGTMAEWDFYGGSLEGIRQKLDYLKDLGVTILYLNPIFEAESSHRYDTADYLHIDPVLGDENDFCQLCSDAQARGISIILDGVFNHSGRDSRYFNRWGNYALPGAWQDEGSPYRNWYDFRMDGTYTGWWGDANLPAFNEGDPEFRAFICGEDGVVRRWMRAGARGWRLDVADELSDDFIEQIKEAILAERPDAVLVGEVWEDASNKRAYGKLRHYFQGTELDGVMNYPLRSALLSYVRNEICAGEVARRLQQLCENYPRESLYGSLNLMGSHDRERLFTMLGGAPDPDVLSDEQQRAYRLNDHQRGLATARLWICALLQMTLPGVPCIYYGDERGAEGYRDPYNRAPYPWEGGHGECSTVYRNAIALRKTLKVLIEGDFEPFACNDDVFGFWRRGVGESVCVLVNASLDKEHAAKVPMAGEAVADIVSGRRPRVEGDMAEVALGPLGSSVLHFTPRLRLQKPLDPGLGVLCHVTSLPNLCDASAEEPSSMQGQCNPNRPSPDNDGALGASARRFIDWLAEGNVRYWQVLPVNPVDSFGSPYAGLSAFAGNVTLLGSLVQDFAASTVCVGSAAAKDEAAYRGFCKQNEYWLEPYCTFSAIKERMDGEPWHTWPHPYRHFEPELAARADLANAVERNRQLQFAFERQWNLLRSYAHEHGIMIIGDMPLYVNADSCDVWANPGFFDVDERGCPRRVAGAPGDGFASEGQNWGNPIYSWERLKQESFDWWIGRIQRSLDLYDYVRLDHFIGFSSFYSMAAGSPATSGSYAFGPGRGLFEKAYEKLGPLPFVAEDLGNITPAVRALASSTGFPGMDVIQFCNEDIRHTYSPAQDCVVYTGTHDNQTLLGWSKERFGVKDDEAVALAERLCEKAILTDANVVILPLQDILGLDDDARMNTPGTTDGNWTWQASWKDIEAAAPRLRHLSQLHANRKPPLNPEIRIRRVQ